MLKYNYMVPSSKILKLMNDAGIKQRYFRVRNDEMFSPSVSILKPHCVYVCMKLKKW